MCVQYAVDYPDRCESASQPLDLISVGRLTFASPDTEAFPLLSLAARAMSDGGSMPAILNAADEVAVSAFLAEKIGFLDISDTVIKTYEAMRGRAGGSVDELIAADREARRIAEKIISNI